MLTTFLFLALFTSVPATNIDPLTPRDEFGNPILPGYRKPFQKGYDPRRFKGPYKSHKSLSVWDASRLLSKVEGLVDELRNKKSRKKGRVSASNETVSGSVSGSEIAPIS